MKTVGIVIVNWNGKENVLDCLQSIKNSKLKLALEIIVVDNASSDNSIGLINSFYPDVRIIANEKNLGFSGGNNQGIIYALEKKCEYIFLLNNDTVLSPLTVQSLFDRMEESDELGLVGPKIYFAPGFEFHKTRYKQSKQGKIIWYAGGIIDWKNCLGFHRGVDEFDHGQYEKEEETDFVSGCALFVRSTLFQEIGLLDHRYYLYYEDLDFNIRVKRAGYKIHYIPTSWLWHKNAGSSHSGSDLQDYYMTRNRLLLGLSYAPISTKLSLIRESLGFLWHGRKWQKRGVVDAFISRWGRGSYA